MRIHPSRAGGRARVAALAALVTLAAAVPAIAAVGARPEKGKTYSGVIRRTSTVKEPISFKVSRTGRSVKDFKFSYPVYCQGGGFPGMKSRPATISRKGSFTAKLPLKTIIPPRGRPDGTVIVTGKFGRHGSEKGEVITKLKHGTTCNGKSSYSTKAG